MNKLATNLFFFLLLSSSVYAQRTITGTIIDENREPLPFVTVSIVGTTTGTATDINGRFSISVPASATAIRASFIGFKTQDIELGSATSYTIILESTSTQLEQVVIVGNMERRVESFTGSFTAVSGNELRQMGSQNLVESLRSLDPSFVVMENMAMGADPNAMPTIEIRGQTSIVQVEDMEDQFRSNPNQPLFILDGFETSLQRIRDLDPNRIESVVILKDAASTAMYGSRAANGVVVVTTIPAETGKYRVFYTGDFGMQIPNLGSYNMMNAAQKLEFERLSGRYTFPGAFTDMWQVEHQENLDRLYNYRLAEVARGLNTDWMSMPLQIPFTQRHSFRVTGGTDQLTLNANITYRTEPGVMKGSGRNSWATGLQLTYRAKNFRLDNRLELNGFRATESPWGKFDTWVGTNPYYRALNSEGDPDRFLDQNILDNRTQTKMKPVVNPLYLATRLNSFNEQTNTTIDEKINARWDFHPKMNLTGIFQLMYRNTTRIKFDSPEHPDFEDVEESRKGLYTNRNDHSLSYTTNVTYTYRDRIDKHEYALNVRGDLLSEDTEGATWYASGFPFGTPGHPSFATNFTEKRPLYSNNRKRSMGLLASGNYSWDNKYLFDATLRYDGSSVFGASRMFTPFWGLGTGWNIHNEPYMRQFRKISMLRLKGSIGQLGNQNLASSNNSTIYSYSPSGNIFGTGIFPWQLGNPDIEWQKTLSSNLSLDLNLFDNRFTSKIEIWEKRTNPLMVFIDQPASTGAKAFPMSMGVLTYRGLEFDVSYQIIRTRDVHWRLRAFGSFSKGVYSDFNEKIAGLNNAAANSGSLQKFEDGRSPETIWAVRSFGIDPATGREVFMDRFGNPTFTYDPKDIVPVGERRPFTMGAITSTLMFYSQFTIMLNFNYSIRSEKMNQTLFDKVENISMNQVAYNQDVRALENRWKEPGQVAEFTNINLVDLNNARTIPRFTDRFLQREDFLRLSNISLIWDVPMAKYPSIRNAGFSSLKLQASVSATSGIFNLTNIQIERGTQFPEATTINLSINASF